MKDFINKILKKIFGKRCTCKPKPTHCVRCGDLFKDCACVNHVEPGTGDAG